MAERGGLVRLREHFEFDLDWRGFELHPETPPGGMAVADLMGSADAAGFMAYLDRFAAEHGVAISQPDRIPNTRRALAVTELARERGLLTPFREAAMEAHWVDGRDIEADDDLRELAAVAGLDPVEALAAADSPVYLARVDALREEAHGRGVTGIPTLFVGEQRLVGCRSYPELERAAEAAGVPRA